MHISIPAIFARTSAVLATVALGVIGLLAPACAHGASVSSFVEYVESDGNGGTPGEYVLLDYAPSSNSVVEAEVAIRNLNNSHGIFCTRGSTETDRPFTLFYVGKAGLRWDYNRTTAEYQAGMTVNTKYGIRCTSAGLWLNGVESSTINITPSSFTPPNRMMLFASYTCQPQATPLATGNYAYMRLYAFRAWDDNGATLRVDLYPCVDTDGVTALYDTVTGKLFYNRQHGKALTASATVVPGPTGLHVSGTPTGVGSPSLAYGYHSNIVAGASMTLSAPAWTNTAQTVAATCTGWKLYDLAGNQVDTGTGASFVYVHTNPAVYRRLEWQWQTTVLRCFVSVGEVAPCYTNVTTSLSCADPADDLGGGYFDVGALLKLSITNSAGRFDSWQGDVPAGVDATATTITWTVSSAYTAIRPRLDGWIFTDRAADVTSWYLDFTDGSNENDGRSWETSLATLSNALARARANYAATGKKQYIYLPSRPGVTANLPKTYSLGTTDQTICYFTLDIPVVLQGAGRREDVRMSLKLFPSSNGGYKAGVFKIAHADAVMRNLTLTGMTASKYTYPLRITSGTFDNCVFTKNTNGDYDWLAGAIIMSGGVITNSLISENTMQNTVYQSDTSGIYMTDGLVTHSIICSNRCANKSYGGGVCMLGGTLRNTLVYGNEAIQNASGVYAIPTTVCQIENCTIADNVTKAGTSYSVYGLRAHGSDNVKKTIVRNTIVYGNDGNTAESINAMNLYRNSDTYVVLENNLSTTPFADSATASGNLVGDPCFIDAAARDYTLSFSAAVDTGQSLDWMATSEDLASHARILGTAVDIGAYEHVPSAELDGSFTIATLNPGLNTTTRLQAVVSGGTAPYSYKWTINGVVVVEGNDQSTLDYVFPSGNHTVTLVVTDAVDASIVRGAPGTVTVRVLETYVGPGGFNTEPYDTPAKAAHDIIDAHTLTDAGGTVRILPGNYTLASQIKFSRANVTIRSTEGPAKTVFAVAPGVSAVNLAAAGAILDGITLEGFNATAVTFYYNDTIVTNCVIRRGTAQAINFGARGLLANCTVEGVTNSAQVIYMQSNQAGGGTSTLRNCRFLKNCSTGNYTFHFLNQGVIVRNCLFADNRSNNSQAFRIHSTQMGKPTFESCTFVNNVGSAWASVESTHVNYTIYFRNNIYCGNVTKNGLTTPPGESAYLAANNCVVDATNNTYGVWNDIFLTSEPGLRANHEPMAGSVCIDNGLDQTWMTTALDLNGLPRIQKKSVDIGAFEWKLVGSYILVR